MKHVPVNLSYPTVGVVVCAGGKGTRAGFEKNKVLALLDGETVLAKTLCVFDYHAISQIIVTANAEDFDEIDAVVRRFARAKTVLGGKTRTESVFNALKETTTDLVLIHDGARPYIQRQTVENCIDCLKANGSAVCAVPATDTLATVENGTIQGFVNRQKTYAVQTPQGFETATIRTAYERAFLDANTDFTDDSSLYLHYVKSPVLCAGAPDNKKVTYKEDFVCTPKVGFGVDTHAFGKEQNFITLCGVQIPSKTGLIAHSDGDVAVHALMDALLSAVGLKDIGHYFPDTDERFRGVSSLRLLDEVLQKVREQGYAVHNVSIAIQAEKPRLAPYIESMQQTLATALSLPVSNVGITVGTNEKLGYVGEGKGITVYAYVSVKGV